MLGAVVMPNEDVSSFFSQIFVTWATDTYICWRAGEVDESLYGAGLRELDSDPPLGGWPH